MITALSVAAAILLVFVAYSAIAPLAFNLSRFWGNHPLNCPNRHELAEVQVFPARAALSAAYGAPELGLRRCSLLGPGQSCNEACLKSFAA